MDLVIRLAGAGGHTFATLTLDSRSYRCGFDLLLAGGSVIPAGADGSFHASDGVPVAELPVISG